MEATKKKMGRPVIGSPKTNDIKVRIDDESRRILNEYCAKENVNQMEAVRRGIKKLDEK